MLWWKVGSYTDTSPRDVTTSQPLSHEEAIMLKRQIKGEHGQGRHVLMVPTPEPPQRSLFGWGRQEEE